MSWGADQLETTSIGGTKLSIWQQCGVCLALLPNKEDCVQQASHLPQSLLTFTAQQPATATAMNGGHFGGAGPAGGSGGRMVSSALAALGPQYAQLHGLQLMQPPGAFPFLAHGPPRHHPQVPI